MLTKSSKIVILLCMILIFPVIYLLRERLTPSESERADQADATVELYDNNLTFEPAYLALHRTGELKLRGEQLWEIMGNCRLCARLCDINRLEGETGFCRAPGTRLFVASAGPHFGEERPLVGWGGSGTIFLSHCALRCVFCINWNVSQEGMGVELSLEELAAEMMALQNRGVHNINLVTPNHYVAHIVKAIDIAAGKGLRLPIVFNTCSFIPVEILRKLDGIIDIYLPDIKFSSGEVASRLAAGASNYPEVAKAAVLEMYRQVGGIEINADGIATRGLMIRHLVMPNNAGGSLEILDWIANYLPKDTYVNIMAQYRPVFKAHEFEEIARNITEDEYREVVYRARELGLTNLDIQGFWMLQ